ncbi:long-chain fatty acid--CoA ligase [bacterium]|nr:long-chain fatty acid--CoA ligase [bacterium]
MKNTKQQTLAGMFLDTSGRLEHRVAVRYKKNGRWQEITFAEFRKKVFVCACGLKALGCERGDHIGILSENRPEWFLSDLAALCLGCASVPLYATLKQDQVSYIAAQSEIKIIFIENREQLGKIRHVLDDIPKLEKLIVFDPVGVELDDRVISFQEFFSTGEKVFHRDEQWILNSINSVKPEDLASLVYTSGTTGHPKGVMLSHSNFVSNVQDIKARFVLSERDVILGILPLCHVLERCGAYYSGFLASGAIYTFSESMETVARDMIEAQPTIVVAVPRLFEKIYIRIIDMVESGTSLKKGIFRWALQVGRSFNLQKRVGTPGVMLRQQHRLAHKLVFVKLHQRFGGRIRYFISGGASLEPKITQFFASVGIKIMEGYGLTETSPVNTVNNDDAVRIGSVGIALDHVKIKLAMDGEILVKGPNVTLGYYRKPEETQELFDDEGWLKTGDIGRIDEDGFLWIIDRKKEIIVTSGGKNIAPQPIEAMLSLNTYINNVMLIGDRKNYISALIVPDFDKLAKWCVKAGLGDLTAEQMIRTEEVYSKIQAEIMENIAGLPRFEQVKQIVLLARAWTVESGELTPTMKLKRRVILRKYGSHIDALYRSNFKQR